MPHKFLQRSKLAPAAVWILAIAACTTASRDLDDAALRAADAEAANWITYGRTYSEQRFSPLRQIDERSVGRLGLAWSLDLGTLRGLEATPLVKDGVLYTTSAWSLVYAVDARTGRLLWTYDPHVPKDHAKFVCCDVVNRGVALYRSRVYVGVLDGRLIALDAQTGARVWEVETTPTGSPYAITGAPRIAKGRVVIGNAGAEYAVRGYVSAYDAETGKLVWRTYTVPGDPSKPFESEAMRRAAATWSGEWWKAGGGGNAWDALVYDPDLDFIYFGTGNGSPWYERLRSGSSGDNLYISSIVALRAENGEQRSPHAVSDPSSVVSSFSRTVDVSRLCRPPFFKSDMGINTTETLCSYCGRNPVAEEDHVIARQFFSPEEIFRGALPKVPACGDCNRVKQRVEDTAGVYLQFGHAMETAVRADIKCRVTGRRSGFEA